MAKQSIAGSGSLATRLAAHGRRDWLRGLGSHQLLALLLVVHACAPSEPQTADAEGEVCARCRAGETSDFGSTPEPTPCERSEEPSQIDEARARELGYGATLDLLTRSFAVPFAWTPSSTHEGKLAEGYAPVTIAEISTRIASIEHRVPQLADCKDSLRVALYMKLATKDRAIAVEGELTTRADRDLHTDVAGRIDLRGVRGSLRVPVPETPEGIRGTLAVTFVFYPDAVRGSIAIILFGVPLAEDVGSYRSDVLDGRFPIDDCDPISRPLKPTDSLPTPVNQSPLGLRDNLLTMLENEQPTIGKWSNGAATALNIALGTPSNVCVRTTFFGESDTLVGYEIPLRIRSEDGSVDMDRIARGHAAFDEGGALTTAWLVVSDEAIPAATFAETSGISGVDLHGFPEAGWLAEVKILDSDAKSPRGYVRIDGITAEGRVEPEIEKLSWP